MATRPSRFWAWAEPGWIGDETQQHRPRLVELAQLDVLLGEGDVGVGGAGRQLDGLLELALGVGEAALTPEDVGEREMGRRVAGLERDGLVRRLDGLGRLVGARQPLGELHPQPRRVGIAVDGLAERGDGVLDAACACVHLGDRVVVVRGGARVADLRGRCLGRRLRGIGGAQGLHRRAAGENDRGRKDDPESGHGCSEAARARRSPRASKSLVRSRLSDDASAGSGTCPAAASTRRASSTVSRL